MAKKGKRSAIKSLFVWLLALVVIAVLVAGTYVAYVFLAYSRIEDNVLLKVEGAGSGVPVTGAEYKLISFNIGFGAYEPDYGFFMDGGTQSRAWSYDRLVANIERIGEYLLAQNADFINLQEVDTDGTRTYHYDERVSLNAKLSAYSSVYAQNYDSPYLFYPITEPIGANRSGIISYSRFAPASSLRRSLPVESGVRKLLDLDRCYSVTRYALENGRELIIVNLHLSAYTADGKISDEQAEMIIADMRAEYEKGNYVVCAGDFNKNLFSADTDPFKASDSEYAWAKCFPFEKLQGTGLSIVAPTGDGKDVPSCRNADGPYTPEQFVITIDGFIVSNNVKVISSRVEDTGFAYSDHNPVTLVFELE